MGRPWPQHSAAVEQLEKSNLLELKTVIETFIRDPKLDAPPDVQTRARWRRRYAAAVERLRQAGIRMAESGVNQYIALRSEWDPYITLLAPRFAYSLDEVDTALAKVK